MPCAHPKPTNTKLYNTIKQKVKHRVKRWPSAYASGQLVHEYKQKGGKYTCSFGTGCRQCSFGTGCRQYNFGTGCRQYNFGTGCRQYNFGTGCNNFGSLDRWFKERWVNVCKKGLPPCGRKKSSPKDYPYCRPLKRISAETPKTVKELSKSEIKRRCSIKRKIKYLKSL